MWDLEPLILVIANSVIKYLPSCTIYIPTGAVESFSSRCPLFSWFELAKNFFLGVWSRTGGGEGSASRRLRDEAFLLLFPRRWPIEKDDYFNMPSVCSVMYS